MIKREIISNFNKKNNSFLEIKLFLNYRNNIMISILIWLISLTIHDLYLKNFYPLDFVGILKKVIKEKRRS